MLPVTPIIRLDFDIADSVVCLGFHFIETNHECLFQIHVYDNYLLNEVPFYFILMSIQHIWVYTRDLLNTEAHKYGYTFQTRGLDEHCKWMLQ